MNIRPTEPEWPSGSGEMAQRLRDHDWARTSLGLPGSWPRSLRTLVAIMMNSCQPMFIVWGPERTLIYNDGYSQILASKHPDALGGDFLKVWHEIRDDLVPIVSEAYAGRSVFMDDIALVMQRRGFSEEAHFSFSYTPIEDDAGGIAGFFCPCMEITRQVVAERALLRSSEREAFLLKLSDALRTVEDPVEVQTIAACLLGARLGANRVAYAEDVGDGEAVILRQNYTDGVPEIKGRYYYRDLGENLVRELRQGRTVVRPDVANDALLSEQEKAAHAALQLGATLNVPLVKGADLVAILTVHYTRPHAFADEEVALIHEVAERTWAAVARARAESRLRETEARFRHFGDASSNALWIRNAQTLEWEYLSAAFDRIYGVDRVTALQSRGIGFLSDLILPEDRHPTMEAIRRLRDGPGDYAYRIRRPCDGEIRWLRTTGFRLVDGDGVVRRLGGITYDVTEEKHTMDRMEVLVSELQHRTRNLIGVVRAIASRTLKTSSTLDDFRPRFGERLEALARVNGLLSRLEECERVTFDELLAAELAGHGLLDDNGLARQVALDGPAGVSLPSAAVQTLALALHELLTNAEKHGALTRPEGRLVIKWELIREEEPRLRVDWLETGIAGKTHPPRAAADGGYGRQLIERALPYQLGAQISYALDDEELRCVIVLPISQRQNAVGDD